MTRDNQGEQARTVIPSQGIQAQLPICTREGRWCGLEAWTLLAAQRLNAMSNHALSIDALSFAVINHVSYDALSFACLKGQGKSLLHNIDLQLKWVDPKASRCKLRGS